MMTTSIRQWGQMLCLAMLTLGISSTIKGAPVGDYGDAPDPMYPSLYESDGPYHLDTTKEWIGAFGGVSTGSTTTVENDSLQVNSDYDDAAGVFFTEDIYTLQRQFFQVTVSYDQQLSSPDTKRYLNVLIDANDNGQWDGGREWAVVNSEFDFSGLPDDVWRLNLVNRIYEPLTSNEILNTVTRVTLTTEPVSNPYGAWGELARGETEDWANGWVDEASGVIGGPGGVKITEKLRDRLRAGTVNVVPRSAPLTGCPQMNTNQLYTVQKVDNQVIDDKRVTLTWKNLGGDELDIGPAGYLAKVVPEPNAAATVPINVPTVVYDETGVPPLPDFFGPGNDVLQLRDWHCLVPADTPGRALFSFESEILFDPDNEYYLIKDGVIIGEDTFVVPVPGAFGAGMMLLAGLGLRRFRARP